MTNGTHDILCPPDLCALGRGRAADGGAKRDVELVEFPDIGHADLVECPQDAIRIVTDFFHGAEPSA